MPDRQKPKFKRAPAGRGKPGVPYIPIYPPKPDDGEWFWDYEIGKWVSNDPYEQTEKKAA